MPIKLLLARQVLDSSGCPTVEVDLVTELGLFRAAAPPGPSGPPRKGEPLTLRDGDPARYNGRSVAGAVKNVNTIIAPELLKMNLEVTMQKEIDEFLIALDGSDNKGRLGANAILAVSLAVLQAGAAKLGLPLYRHVAALAGAAPQLPVPLLTVLVGGCASSNRLPFQEYMVMPTGATSFAQALQMGCEIYEHVRSVLEERHGKDATWTSECGGMGAPAGGEGGGEGGGGGGAREPLQLLVAAVEHCGYRGKVELAIHAAAGDFYKDGVYDLDAKNPNSNPQDYLKAERLATIYGDLAKEFGVACVIDPFASEDWAAWAALSARGDVLVVGGELTQSTAKRVSMAADKRACGAVALRLGQVASVTEALAAAGAARAGRLALALADRGGAAEGAGAADAAVGLGATLLAAGAPRRERLARYNQLLRLEEELGATARYVGKNYRNVQ
ncbi:hypothetical protein JYU34_000785 [Plutella xylostella]|uniref:Enolase n=1 Tax=Plutella xylostella TaxID=51655 RepID=A0ABQ7R8L2_PLUXY|nr:hypothetical protein JYU34_000785 [Plutella xylostella]